MEAIRRLTAEGLSINVTLIFSLSRYAEVIEAYQQGLVAFRDSGGKLKGVNSVASFFVSRVDTEVDPRLDTIGTAEAKALLGKAAIANARAAYGIFLERFRSPEWMDLSRSGARGQRPLWASTSTKNPAYPDTMYVTGLVAPHTVNTMPLETMDAYQDHGTPLPQPFGELEVVEAHKTLADVSRVGVDLDDVGLVLESQGVEKFSKSWEELVDTVEAKRVEIVPG